MAHPRAHPALGARGARRFGCSASRSCSSTSDGLNDYQGRPLGTDFSNVYAAGTYVLDGKPAARVRLAGAARARAGRFSASKTPFYGWHYPPYFLFIAGLLALMPYALALAAWQAATLALYLGAVG